MKTDDKIKEACFMLIMRSDSVPKCCQAEVERLKKRALKCGMKIIKEFDRTLNDGTEYRTLIFRGPRLAMIRYFGTDVISGNYKKGCLSGLLKLMFL